MEHMNHCRQMVKYFTRALSSNSAPPAFRGLFRSCIDLAKSSVKFMLPDGGRLYEDPEYRALDDSIPISLPYPLIAIEFTRTDSFLKGRHYNPSNFQPSKALLFASEEDEVIGLTVVVYNNAGGWVPLPRVAIPRTGYLERSALKGSRAGVKLLVANEASLVPISDYGDEVEALLGMLNILQCGNVHVEKSTPKKSFPLRNNRSALPFDSYHILTVGGSEGAPQPGCLTGGHRSPREHLRRGHIRRLGDGRRVWVNATVVAAGRGAGVIRKDYTVAT